MPAQGETDVGQSEGPRTDLCATLPLARRMEKVAGYLWVRATDTSLPPSPRPGPVAALPSLQPRGPLLVAEMRDTRRDVRPQWVSVETGSWGRGKQGVGSGGALCHAGAERGPVCNAYSEALVHAMSSSIPPHPPPPPTRTIKSYTLGLLGKDPLAS